MIKLKYIRFVYLFFIIVFGTEIKAQNTTAIDSLKRVLLSAQEDTGKIRIYNKLLNKLYGIGNYKEGLDAARQSYGLSKKLNFKKGMADACNNIGLMFENLDLRDSALFYYLFSLNSREKTDGKKPVANTLNNIANIYRNKGDFVEAIKYNVLALKLREEMNDSAGLAISLNNIGMVYSDQNNHQEAIENFTKSLSISMALNDKRSMSMTYNNMSLSYKVLRNYDEAISYLKKAIELNKLLSNKHWLAKNLSNLGNMYKLKAAELDTKADTTNIQLYCQKSYEAFTSAFELINPTENKEGYIEACNSIGEFSIDRKKLKEAEIYYRYTLPIVDEVDNQKLKKETYEFSSRLFSELASQKDLKDSVKAAYLKKSLEYYQKSALLKDSLLSEANTREIAEVKTRYETDKKDKEIQLLNNEKNLQQLSMKQQQDALLLSKLMEEKIKNENEGLIKTRSIQELTISNTQQQLTRKEAETRSQSIELQLMQQHELVKENELHQQKLIRNGLLAGTLFLGILGVLLFNRFHLRKKIENQQQLLNERKRISTELHDDLGSGLSTIRFLSEIAKTQTKDKVSKEQLEKISYLSNNLVDNMRQIVWTMNTEQNTIDNLVQYLKKYVNEYSETNNLSLKINFPEDIPERLLSGDVSRNIFLVIKECLHNIVKHAQANTVDFSLEINDHIKMVLHDNGKGIPLNPPYGNGLINMRKRMEACGGSFEIENRNGTEVTLRF